MNRTGTIWILLALVVLGLLAFFAFGGARIDTADTPAEETAQAVDRSGARAAAEAELVTLRARAEAGETYADLEEDFAQVRARTAAAYENAEGAAAEEWADLSAGFDAFEASARAGTSDFLDSISDLISRFSADVRVETEAE